MKNIVTLSAQPSRFALRTLALGAVTLLAACATQGPGGPLLPPSGPVKLTVLHTNDHHGRFWKNSDGEYGMAARKTVLDQVRAEVKAAGGHTLLLDGGDVNTGVPESDTQDAEPDFKGMKLLGYDAMTFGNHEFDKPLPVLAKQVGWAGFPVLSANIYKDGKRFAKPYEVFERGGLKIAVMGLTTDDTNKMVDPANIAGMEFRKPAPEAAALMPELKKQAHVVIAATHMGHYPNNTRGVNAEGDVEMARTVKGFDLIVGGHSQNPVCMITELTRNETYQPGGPCQPDRQNGAWIVQAHEWGKYVGRADFEYRNGEFKLVRYALIPVNLKKTIRAADGKTSKEVYTSEISEDKTMLALLSPFQEFGQQKLLVNVGSSDGKLDGDRDIVRRQPTALAVLIGQAMMDKTRANFAVMNAGGVRDSLPMGELTYKDVLKVHPFGNTLVTLDLTGKEVIDYLNVAAKMTPGAGAFPHFAGISLEIQAGTVSNVSIQGIPIDMGKTYKMAINNFVAAGGDGYPKMTAHPSYVDTGFVDADALRGFITSRSPLKAADYAPGNSVVRK